MSPGIGIVHQVNLKSLMQKQENRMDIGDAVGLAYIQLNICPWVAYHVGHLHINCDEVLGRCKNEFYHALLQTRVDTGDFTHTIPYEAPQDLARSLFRKSTRNLLSRQYYEPL